MDKRIRTASLIIISVIVIFLLFSIYPGNSQQLQGSIVIQQPAGLIQEDREPIKEGILLSSGTGTLKGSINLADWKSIEIAQAISKYNDKLDPEPYNYNYNDDCSYYSQYGDLFGKDIFCSLTFPIQGPQGEEWNDGHLRIKHLGYDVKESSEAKYKDYLNDVLKETQLDSSLSCYTQKECNDINVIVCTKDSHNYFSWFEGNVLMTSVDDARRNLNAFTRFYCSSELKPLTGSIVSSLVKEKFITDKLAALFKKLS